MIPAYVLVGAVWAGLALLAGVLMVWFGLEALTYWLREPQITPYVRTYVAHRPTLTLFGGLLLVAGASAALTHFWLDR